MRVSAIHLLFFFPFALFSLSQKDAARYTSAPESCCDGQFDSLSGKKVCRFTEQMPEFPGGEAALMKFLQTRVRLKEEHPVQSTFYLAFVVDESGKAMSGRMSNKRPEKYTATEKSMVQLPDSMPLWKPGLCHNQPVAVLIQIPLRVSPK
ncbi:MAG: hypothetical protein MUC87_18495 [Bacteroidia bacterium]|jgi:protein TonB|nr:hypothetical protein [Bacteroidia bacterium]